MFLPVVLLHRYGWQGFLMFAIPNVLGCTAFGYVIRTPDRSKKLVKQYGGIMSLFAIVTVAFHLFFLAMISVLHFPEAGFGASIVIPIAILFLGAALALLPNRLWPMLATVVWILSLFAGFTMLPVETSIQPTHPWQDVVWLWPITTFGFVLCPYLDPTFHRAMQSSPSKHAFGIFGIAFAIMIAVTCVYHNVILATLTILLALHLVIQSTFTIGAHLKEGWKTNVQQRRKGFILLLVTACTIAIAVAHRSYGGEDSSVNDYIRFFVFYGLIFPALVVTFMFTKRSFTAVRTILFCLAIILSLPLLELGYLHGSAWLSVLPVVLFLTWAFADCKTAK